MRRLSFVFVALATMAGIGFAASVAAAGQSSRPSARTPWGDPDLQGQWTNSTVTPLERPSAFAGKELLTDEDVADLQEQARNRGDRPPRAGDTGTYNDFWTDRGKPTNRTSLIIDPPDGKFPALTADGQKRQPRGTDSWEDRNMWERCLTRSLPNAMLPSGYNSNYRILQSPGYVAIRIEMLDTRIIAVDGRPHVGPQIRQWMGDSRGHWEGDTLVVETTGFVDRASALQPWQQFRPAGGTGESMRTVERFTRTAADTISYNVTVDDPKTYTRPWTLTYPFRRSQEQLFEYACHETNYGLIGILKGARNEETAAAEERARKGSR